uniref:Peptidase S1 domain-containing protein n=1 Tax=Globodera pallida TaxID=36090 RepID=A0A183CM69_GLOPA
TKITPLAPAECKLCAVKQRPKKCVSFNTTNAHHLAGNPLISHGSQIDIGIMPWAVHISIEKFFNTTTNKWIKRTCTEIAPNSKGFRNPLKRQSNSNVFIHPKSNLDDAGIYDFALIKLNNPICGPIYPICIHCGPAGKFRSGKTVKKPSKQLLGRFVQLTDCKKAPNINNKICIGFETTQSGDSGSALLASNGTNFVQIGVLSGKPESCRQQIG